MRRLVVVCVVMAALGMPAGALASGVVVKVERGSHLLAVAGAQRVLLVHSGAVGRVRVGDRVAVSGRMLRNGTFGASRVRVLGHTRRVSFRGLLLSRSRGSRLMVSAAGAPVTVVASAAAAAGAQPGSEVEVAADVNDAGELDASKVAVVATTAASGSLEGHLLALGSGTITVGADGQALVLTVPSGFNLSGFTVGEEVLAVFSQQSDGTFLLSSLSGNATAQQANQGKDSQGDDNAGSDASGSDDDNGATTSTGNDGGNNVSSPTANGDDGATNVPAPSGTGQSGGTSTSDGGGTGGNDGETGGNNGGDG